MSDWLLRKKEDEINKLYEMRERFLEREKKWKELLREAREALQDHTQYDVECVGNCSQAREVVTRIDAALREK